MSRTVLITFDLKKSSKSLEEIEGLIIGLSIGEVVRVGHSTWLVRTDQTLGDVAASIGAADSGNDRWMAVNVSNRIFSWSGQDKPAHAYMTAINKALQKISPPK